MDRRSFIKTFFSAPFLTPLLARARCTELGIVLYLISDHPQDHLPVILGGIGTEPSFWSGRFSFHNPHPSEEEIKRVLGRIGWRYASPASLTGLSLSFTPLHHAARPSFTLVCDGKIRDIRSRRLSRLWKEMNESEPESDCLTIASIQRPRPPSAPGLGVAIYTDGKKRHVLALAKNQAKRFASAGGEVVVGIEKGKAQVLASTCRHKICQSSPPASLAGERIICAPNRFLLEIEGPRLVDTVTG
jgi:hypothetical protein